MVDVLLLWCQSRILATLQSELTNGIEPLNGRENKANVYIYTIFGGIAAFENIPLVAN